MKPVIVIPVYAETPDKYELKSLIQCKNILGHYDTVLIYPEDLDVSAYTEAHTTMGLMPLPSANFKDVMAYNKMLLEPSFYSYFDQYDYMLIYQLDAWVFSDQVMYWCQKGYDYIGAPDADRRHQQGVINKIFARILFNGGLSLRHIGKSIKITTWYQRFWAKNFHGNEDTVFSAHFARFFLLGFFIKLPDFKTALKFAFEKTPEKEFAENNKELPFGCHAFRRYEPAFWEKHGIK